MNTIKGILFCLCIGLSSAMYAQEDVKEEATLDRIYTTVGSVFIGEIIDWSSEGIVTIRFKNGTEMRLRESQIRKIRQVTKNGWGIKKDKPYAFRETGFYNVAQIGFSTQIDVDGIGFTHAVGYRFSRLLGVGIGAGFENFELGNGREVLPVFAEVRGFLFAKKMSPYYAVRVGHGFAIGDERRNVTEAEGGVLFNPEIGYRFGGGKGANFFAGIGAHFQKATFTNRWPWSETVTVDEVWYQRTELRIGLMF